MKRLKTYRKVFKDVYPKLRTAKTEILVVKDKKTDAEMSVLSKQVCSRITLCRHSFVSTNDVCCTPYSFIEEKAGIYEAATKKEQTGLLITTWVRYISHRLVRTQAMHQHLLTRRLHNLRSHNVFKMHRKVHANLASAHM
jgi:hypothetical protein